MSSKYFNNMGKIIPDIAKHNALNCCLSMGLDNEQAIECIDKVIEQLKNDNPEKAMKYATYYLDITGTYRLIATLLTF